MPIEIRELIIKATVDASSGTGKVNQIDSDEKAENMVQESIDQFAEILKQEKER